ncbi:MAG: glycosyltransferase, partial [Candidatus Aminicenantes bacterium]|nr:glycosyltransferase [Candidatus Aminicenantes bacterium]
KRSFIFLPEFCQKDIPLAKFLSLLTSRKIIFDPLAPRYETKITDWKRKPPDSWQARWNFTIDSWAFELSDLILADTRAHKEYYCEKYGLSPDKVEVLPVGYDDELYRPVSAEKKEDRFTVLFYGSFLPLHGADAVVEAAKIVSKEDASIEFELIGSGQTLPRVRALADELNLSNIRFESWLPQSELPQRIAAADICLGIFGRTEKAGRVVPHKIYQSMGMKKAIITAQTPAVEEFFSHRENIFLVPEPYPENLAQAVLELKRNKDLKEEIAKKGDELVRREYSPSAIGRSLIQIIQKKFITGERSRVS